MLTLCCLSNWLGSVRCGSLLTIDPMQWDGGASVLVGRVWWRLVGTQPPWNFQRARAAQELAWLGAESSLGPGRTSRMESPFTQAAGQRWINADSHHCRSELALNWQLWLLFWHDQFGFVGLGNHRIIKVGKELEDHQVQPSTQQHRAC